jgi:hypothetical protein
MLNSIQSLLKECGWLSQMDKLVIPTLQKTLLLFESFRNKWGTED